MLSFSDYGIILEIIGFGLFLISAKRMPLPGSLRISDVGSHEKVSERWRYFYWELKGNKSQFFRVVGIVLIIIGLLLQLSYFAD